MRRVLRVIAVAATTTAFVLGCTTAAFADVNVLAVPLISGNDGTGTPAAGADGNPIGDRYDEFFTDLHQLWAADRR